MLTLRTTAEPIWLDLTDTGVRVKVPPLDVACMRAAEYRGMKAAAEARVTTGIADDVTANDAQVGVLEGAFTQERIRALAERIVEWEGVVGEDGVPLPITAESLDAFARHPVAGIAFLRAYERPAQAVVAEGNASARSTAGASQAGPNTAAAANSGAEPAPASSTPPKRKPARPAKPQ
ncbi:hypothetical protein [Roseomonas xinghualingensis]|uniref:hypothetical protein n=1 Tax=Roseomonas xinghualingensis TaxID=2986475 RepID=UPI0021F240A8|nr:hypothetical protein [Roseomonas sp. SXEYE001]MCV4209991.1 hypothetical protein [Roseomonas sp. SXEYE001]